MKNNIKKFSLCLFSLLITALLIIATGLCACGNQEPAIDQTPTEEDEPKGTIFICDKIIGVDYRIWKENDIDEIFTEDTEVPELIVGETYLLKVNCKIDTVQLPDNPNGLLYSYWHIYLFYYNIDLEYDTEALDILPVYSDDVISPDDPLRNSILVDKTMNQDLIYTLVAKKPCENTALNITIASEFSTTVNLNFAETSDETLD